MAKGGVDRFRFLKIHIIDLFMFLWRPESLLLQDYIVFASAAK
jgi:hypothetical protein